MDHIRLLEKLRIFFPHSRKHLALSLGFSILALSLCAFYGLSHFESGKHQVYDDIIASSLTFFGHYKTGDIYFIFFAAAITFSAFFLCTFFTRKLFSTENPDGPTGLNGEPLLFFFNHSLLYFFSLCGFLSLLRFLFSENSLWDKKIISDWVGISFGVFSVLFICLESRLSKGIRFLQLFLPFLLLRFIWVQTSSGAELEPNLFFRGLVWICIPLAMVHIFWSLRSGVSPMGLQAALVMGFLSFRIPTLNPLQLDSYHLGEMLIPFHQWMEFGLRPYVDFVSVHGLLAFYYGLIHRLFFEPTFVSVPYAFSLADSLWSMFLVLCLSFALPSRFIPILSVFFLPTWNRFYFFPVVLIFLVARFWRAPGSAWIIAGFSLGVLGFSFNHAPGLGILLCLLPCLLMAFASLNNRQRGLVFLSCLGILLALSPLWLGALHFVLDNGKGTLQGFGLPLNMLHSPPSVFAALRDFPFVYGLMGNAFKGFKFYGWMVGALCLFSLLALSRKFSWRENFIVFFSLCFCISIIPYTYGRVGTDGLDRVGALAIIILGFVAPFLLVVAMEKRRITLAGFFLLFLALGVRAFPELKNIKNPVSLTTALAQQDPEEVLQESGVARLGQLVARPQEVEAQRDFQALLRERLLPQEGYLDLTNQQTYYFIHGRPSPYLFPSHLLAINQGLQEQIIERMELNPPPLVWISPAHDHEYFHVPLRSYRIYRWLLEHNYVKVIASPQKTFQFLVPSGESTVEDQQALKKLWWDENLGRLPMEWGRNWDRLEERFDGRGQWQLQRLEQGRLFVFKSPEIVEGARVDFFLMDLGGRRGRVHFSFQNEEGSQPSFFFSADSADGKYLLPVGADPVWLLSHNIRSIKFEFENETVGSDIKIKALRLVR